jgi:hypothetical protein
MALAVVTASFVLWGSQSRKRWPAHNAADPEINGDAHLCRVTRHIFSAKVTEDLQ